MQRKLQHKEWYMLVLVLALFTCLAALGGGLFGESGVWFQQWQHKIFAGLCHQDPQRSFWLNGTPTAVCTRCLGIYSGFTFLWMLFPLYTDITKAIRGNGKTILCGLVLLSIIDIAGNSLGVWENTLSSRYLMGSLIGIFAACILGSGFVGTPQPKKKNYGTVRTSQ